MKFVGTFAFKSSESYAALVQKRSKKLPHLDGKWNGIGGKMDIGESPVGAAMREFRDETRIVITKDEMVFVEHQRFVNGCGGGPNGGRYCEGDEIYWYAARIDDWNGAYAPLPYANDVGE